MSVTLPGTGGTTTFKYDPFGRRIQKAGPLGTTNYVYNGANVVAEYNSAGVELAKYAQGPGVDEPLAMSRSGNTVYYSADGLGSVTSLEDGTGSVVASYTYDSFGNQTSPEPTLFNPFRFTGRERDQETGLYYYRARYYDPAAGRFISEDPLGFAGSGPNLYAYVENDPIDLDDPSGLYRRKHSQNSNQEISDDLWNTGNPFAVFRAHQIADEALAAAEKWADQYAPDSLHNGPADAFRHCFWSCTMSKYLGERVAEIIANEHEEEGDRNGQPLAEEQMDRSNNRVGRCVSHDKDSNCWDSCTQKYLHGGLYGLGGIIPFFR